MSLVSRQIVWYTWVTLIFDCIIHAAGSWGFNVEAVWAKMFGEGRAGTESVSVYVLNGRAFQVHHHCHPGGRSHKTIKICRSQTSESNWNRREPLSSRNKYVSHFMILAMQEDLQVLMSQNPQSRDWEASEPFWMAGGCKLSIREADHGRWRYATLRPPQPIDSSASHWRKRKSTS